MQTLYRAFRPDTFDKVVGQDQIVQILKNQVQSGTVGHAYLFHGTRGTGKTSCAKILSRAVNCLNPQHGNPCNECENCLRILEESTMDVTEMDAASNRRIDDIRDLREKVKYLPSQMKKKVIIIDEAHMITTEAFNALLKTLEEPPAHLLFILATTEIDKIPATIASRCQIFTFRRISAQDIQHNLEDILSQIERPVEPGALESIAYAADGAMRDALSSLELVLGATEGTITATDVQAVTGNVSHVQLFTITDAIADKDTKTAMLAVQAIRDAGKEAEAILEDLTEHYRQLITCLVTADRRLFSGSDEQYEVYVEKSRTIPEETLLESLTKLIEAQDNLRYTDNANTLLVTAVLTLCSIAKRKTLEERIAELEAYLFHPKAKGERVAVEPPVQEQKPVTQEKAPPEKETVIPKPTPEEVPIEEPQEETTQEEPATKEFDGITRTQWGKILENIKRRSVPTYAYLHEGKLIGSKTDELTVLFPDTHEIHRNAVSKKENYALIKEEVERLSLRDTRLKFILEKEQEDKGEVADLQSVIDFFGAENIEFK